MDPNELLQSGLLELYALGQLEGDEHDKVRHAIAHHPAVAREFEQIEHALFLLAKAHAIEPPPTAKPLLMARIDFRERVRGGEVLAPVPLLSPQSKIEDFSAWLDRKDLNTPENFDTMYLKIIGHDRQKTTGLLWLRYGAPDETHTDEFEHFLILEGTCDITVGTDVHSFRPGDYFAIPLHINHQVRVTSSTPCKAVLQRVFVQPKG
ncbi:cupin domain-containing protein [Dawidia soli]|uniref:Cupin domain-containing protein n=1 Tax=Dawidia soli TaxID=2782352 RepID=A0AAP2D9D9_9BACT|nr:cupin domain-containing protein [Dawidia soli]MBT1687796.1 cupin domain-containing protein [Dawidia soli]